MQMSPAPELGRYSNASEKYREFKKVIIQLKGSRWNLFLKIDHVFLLDITSQLTSHSAYVATSTELHGVKIDGFLYPNFM